MNVDEKIDSIQLEYTYLLTSQLESQRRYFEEKIARLEGDTHREIDEVMNRARSSVEESTHLKNQVSSLLKEHYNPNTDTSISFCWIGEEFSLPIGCGTKL